MRTSERLPGLVYLTPLALLVLGVSGCRSKIQTKTSSGGPMPVIEGPQLCEDGSPMAADGSCPNLQDEDEGDLLCEDGTPAAADGSCGGPSGPADPIEQKNALLLDGEKLYFQTRDTITLKVKKELLIGGNVLTITTSNKPEGQAGAKVNTLVENYALDAYGLSHDGSFNLVDANDDLIFQFFPGEEGWEGRFFYGKNYVKVYVDDEEQPRYALTELTLKDFAVFGMAVLSFEDNVQVARKDGPEGYQFQGWVNFLSPPVVSQDGTTLSHGIFNIVNPH